MSATETVRKSAILFVDEKPGLNEQLRAPDCWAVLASSGFQLLLATSRKSAQLILAEGLYDIRAVILSTTLEEEGISAVPRFARDRGIDASFYALAPKSETDASFPSELLASGIKGWVARPLEAARLKEVILSNLKGFHASLTADAAAKDKAKVGDEIDTDEDAMVSIRAKGVLSGAKSYFDVYIRLGPGKFIKIVKAGDSPASDLLEKYIKKGVQFFYIRKDIQEAYVRYCEKVAQTLLAKADMDPDLKAGSTLNQGQEAYNLMRTQGINQENLKYAGSFVLNMGKVVKDYKIVENDSISRFLSVVSNYEHNTRIAAMSGMLALTLKLDSEKSAHIIGLAGLLHDVGLMKLGLDEATGAKESILNPEQRKLYETHPAVGAEILAALKRFDPTIIQAVSQHHIRRNGAGFPDRSQFTHIHVCSEIIGIVDEYDYLLRRKAADPTIDIAIELDRIYPGFSRHVVLGFKQTFLVEQAKAISLIQLS